MRRLAWLSFLFVVLAVPCWAGGVVCYPDGRCIEWTEHVNVTGFYTVNLGGQRTGWAPDTTTTAMMHACLGPFAHAPWCTASTGSTAGPASCIPPKVWSNEAQKCVFPVAGTTGTTGTTGEGEDILHRGDQSPLVEQPVDKLEETCRAWQDAAIGVAIGAGTAAAALGAAKLVTRWPQTFYPPVGTGFATSGDVFQTFRSGVNNVVRGMETWTARGPGIPDLTFVQNYRPTGQQVAEAVSLQGQRAAATSAAGQAALSAAIARAGWALAGETFGTTVAVGALTTFGLEIHRQAEMGSASAQRIEDACRRPAGGYR